MKRQELLVAISTVLLITTWMGIYGQSNAWSSYQGNMSWEDANEKCKSIGMRLPTLKELKAAYDSGITKSWQNDGRNYWSSTPDSGGDNYVFNILDGSSHIAISAPVRCRR